MSDEGPRTFWIDENLPPALARWFSSLPNVRGEHFRELRFQETPDREVFLRARESNAVIVSKDDDFANLVTTLGPPPQVVWVRTGNVRTTSLLERFRSQIGALFELLDAGDHLIAME